MVHTGGLENICQPRSMPFGGRDRPVSPRVLSRYRADVQQFGAPVAGTCQRRNNRNRREPRDQLVVGKREWLVDQAVDRQGPLVVSDVGKRTVIAAVKRIQRRDLSTGQHRGRWLSVERRAVAHGHVAALSPHQFNFSYGIRLVGELLHRSCLLEWW